MLAAGPPFFELPMGELPPDVQDLKGLGPLLVRFYKEADVHSIWQRSQRAFAAAVARYQDPVINAIFEANGYVRNPSGYHGHRFQIIMDLLGAPNQVQVRNYRDQYFVVITPTDTPIVDEVRDAYLSYLLDPLSFRFKVVIDEKKGLAKYAEEAPALDDAYKHDFSLLVTKSLIKAIDSRLVHDPDQRSILVDQAMREGYILTEAFANLLPGYEKQEESLLSYYPDLVSAVDTRKVEHEVKNIEFAKSSTPRVSTAPAVAQLSPGEETFEAAEGLYEQEQYQDAQRLYKKVFEQTADKQLHGRSYYRLGLIAIRQNQKDQAVEMFERTVNDNPDPMTTAWAHVYLGRLAQAKGDPDKAKEQFKLALSIDGASPMAKTAAEKGLQSSSSGEKEQ
jgi:tetratricopeptide (TPR) repeat protein